MKKVNYLELSETVLKGNYCSGCGICTGLGDNLKMQLNEYGAYIPVKVKNVSETNIVCPFAAHRVDFNQINKELYKQSNAQFHPDFGHYQNIYAGYVAEKDYRKQGSSGGSVTWLTNELLKENLVDYVLSVQETNQIQIRFKYKISNNPDNNKKSAKSKYYPINLEEGLKFIKQNKGRYAIVGLPCFIKGIHLLKKENEIYNERIKFTISIFCGHLKTTHYLSSLISQFNIQEKNVKHFDFRHKVPGKKASDYASKIETINGEILTKQNKELFGTDWGLGLFKLKACDFCDDIIGETADISFGDAWTPKYEDDYLGTNIIVTRNRLIDKLIKKNIQNKKLNYTKFTEEELLESQAGGFRHRREGLAYRLYLNRKKNIWSPPTRVKPEKIKSKKRRKLYQLRQKLQKISYETPHYRNINQLKKELMPYIKQIKKIYEPSAWVKFKLKYLKKSE